MARQKLQPLTFEEHQQIGKQLSAMDLELIHLEAKLGNAYPLNRGYVKLIKQIDTNLTRLRSKLDCAVVDEFPEKTFTEQTSVYFGSQQADRQN